MKPTIPATHWINNVQIPRYRWKLLQRYLVENILMTGQEEYELYHAYEIGVQSELMSNSVDPLRTFFMVLHSLT